MSETVEVEVTEGDEPGDTLEAVSDAGVVVEVVVPQGAGPGTVLTVEVPSPVSSAMITTPRTRNQSKQEIATLHERLRGVKAEHGAAVKACKDAHQSSGGFARAAKCALDANGKHDEAVAALNLERRMVGKSDLGNALLHAVDNCGAVKSIASTHATAKEAHEAVATQLYAIASIHEHMAELPCAAELEKSKKLADRKLKAAQKRERDLTGVRDSAYHEMRAIKQSIAALEQLEDTSAAPLALNSDGGAAGSSLRGFSPASGTSIYDEGGGDDDDEGEQAAKEGAKPPAKRPRLRSSAPPAADAQIEDMAK
jgi:hypothetical protein